VTFSKNRVASGGGLRSGAAVGRDKATDCQLIIHGKLRKVLTPEGPWKILSTR
jgi:hypothetical protein